MGIFNKDRKDKVVNLIKKSTANEMTKILASVVSYGGSAPGAKVNGYHVAGKTGTTNENQDAWFIGYNSEITVGVFVGYDEPKSLGRFETGSKVVW